MRTIASLLAVAYVFAIVIGLGLFLFGEERTWWLVLLPAAVPWAFLVSLPVAIVLALSGRWRTARWAVLGVTLLAIWLWGGLFLPATPVSTVAAAGAGRLRVLTLNSLVRNHNHDAIVAAIREADADIVAVQELSPEQAAAIDERLGDSYPHRALHPWGDPRGVGLWSRYPLTELETYDEGLWENWAQHVVVDAFGRRIHVFNAHAWPQPLGNRAEIVATAGLRQRQTEYLAGILARIPPVEPFVVAGDFNMVPLNRAYRPLARVARDTWLDAGWGFGFTWPNRRGARWLPPLVRIDYLWHSPGLRPVSVRVLPADTGSDHYGLVGEYLVR